MDAQQMKKERPKILIVDDLSMNVQILENIVEAEGYEPLGALNVQEALDIMKNTMPQVILSDLSMPGMNGIEFCKLLKSNPRTREIPFIVITVANSSEEKKEAFSAGAVDFIPKPFERVEVVMRLKNHLNIYQIKQDMKDYNRLMHKTVDEQLKQMEKEQENVLLVLARIAEKRAMCIEGRLDTIGYNSRLLAQSLQLVSEFEDLIADDFIYTIGTAAKLCDIGNIVLPESLLAEPDSAGSEALRIHTEEGARILEQIRETNRISSFLDMAIAIARYHHAGWDGSGYPQNISKEEIPLAARIVAIANGFAKAAAEGGTLQDSVARMNEGSGTLYDPQMMQVFNKVYKQMKTD